MRAVVRLAVALALGAGALLPLPATGGPVLLDAVVRGLSYARGHAGDLVSYTQSVTPAAPVPLEQHAALLGAGRTPLAAGRDRDLDGALTVSLAPEANDVYFTGEPVVGRGSVFPFLWARKGYGSGAAALVPPLTYHASVTGVRWAFVPGPEPKPSARRGRLVVTTTGITRTAVGVEGASVASRTPWVTTIAGVLGAEGGDIVEKTPNGFPRPVGRVRVRIPKGTFAGDGGYFAFTLAMLPRSATAFVHADVVPGPAYDTLVVGLDLDGRLPRLEHGVVDGERVVRQGVPFVATFVSKAYDETPVVAASPSLVGAAAVVSEPSGRVTRGVLPAGPVRLAGPVLPTYSYGCHYGFGNTENNAHPSLRHANDLRGRHPVARAWQDGRRKAQRRSIASLGAVGLDVDGTVTSLASLAPEVREVAHRVRWGDDTGGSTDWATSSFYGAFTDVCSYRGRSAYRATAVHESPGMKPGAGQRLLYVTANVVAEIRIDAAPDSRSTWTGYWPVLRMTARVWSLDGLPHRVRVRALAEVSGARLRSADLTGGGGTDSPPIENEATLHDEHAIDLAGDGERYRIASGVTAGGLRGQADAGGRYAGPTSVLHAVNAAKSVLADPVPRPDVRLGPSWDLHLMSAPSAQSAGSAYYTGFVAAFLALV